jgi:broad specificity phosphatase PhoE
MLTRQAFWFLRHGETDWNARNLSQGNIDIPLNPVGQAQATTAAGLLRNRGIRTIVSSPLSRAHDTALAAAEVVGQPVLLDDELMEVAFGEQEGQPMGDWYDDWIAGNYTPADGETFAGLRARAVGALNRALEREAVVLVVAHGALFRAVRSAMGLEPNIRTPNAVPLFCEPGPNGGPWTLTPAA